MTEIKSIAKNTSMLAMPKILKFVVGIARAKLVAVILGTEGAGIVSQLQNILVNMSVFANGGLTDGMVKQISKENSGKSRKEEVLKIIKTYIITIGFTTVVITTLGYVFSHQLTQFVFGNKEYHSYFLIGYLGMPILILSSSSFAILKAYKNFKAIMFAEISIIIFNFFIFFFLIYFLRLRGAVIFTTLSYLTAFLAYRYFASKEILKKMGISITNIVKISFSKIYFKELITFFTVSFTIGLTSVFTDIITRSTVTTNLGIEKIGIYSPIIAWSGLFTSFILPSLGVYLFPRVSEAKSDNEISGVTNDSFRLMTMVLMPFIIIAITLRKILIPIFYSNEFLESAIYLPFHFIGIYITVWNYIFIQLFIPSGRIKSYFPIVISQNIIDLVVVYFLVPIYGIWGWMVRFTVTPLLFFIVYYFFWYKHIQFKFNQSNIKLILLVVISSSLILIFRNNYYILIIIDFITLIILWLNIEKNERMFILRKFNFFKHLK